MTTHPVKSSKLGFTLAEVLLTLTIIGVIASLTIPDLVTNVQKQQYASGFKTAYSTLTQAVNGLKDDAGIDNFANYFTSSTDFRDKLSTKINFIKKCAVGTNTGECFTQAVTNFQGTPLTEGDMQYSNGAKAVMANGMTILIQTITPACNRVDYAISGVNMLCGWMYLDVNGLKGPNVNGRDVFSFIIAKNGLVLYGMGDNNGAAATTQCTPSDTDKWNGDACPFKIMTDGAMNY